MNRIAIIAVLGLALAGCANVRNAWEAATSATVSPTAVYVAANTFDALEATATNYIRLPRCGTFPCRDPAVSKKIVAAVRAGRVARNNLETFLANHPGQLGAQGDYDALNAAITTLQTVFTQNNIGSK